MAENTTRFEARIVKHDKNGQGGYRYKYVVFVSDVAGFPNHRIFSVIGPRAFTLAGHHLFPKSTSDRVAVENFLRDLHPDNNVFDLKP
ncbi:MAG: hypothetical protein NTW87_28095 [Planctomycetota bacterium]|nr:hypothetical protein [Planctomycetota bacterium]